MPRFNEGTVFVTTKIKKEEAKKRGYNIYPENAVKFREDAKQNPNFYVYDHPNYHYWFFFDRIYKEMIKVSFSGIKINYKKMKKVFYTRREYRSMLDTGKEYNLYLYRVYNTPVSYVKGEDEPFIPIDRVMSTIQKGIDLREQKKLQDK